MATTTLPSCLLSAMLNSKPGVWPISLDPKSFRSFFTTPLPLISFSASVSRACVARIWSFSRRSENPCAYTYLGQSNADSLASQVDRCNTLLDELTKTLSEIYRNFTSPDAPRPLNLPQPMMRRMNMDIKETTLTTLPAMELIFSDAQLCIENILATDVYPRFVKHQMTVSAEKALSVGRSKYGGLGDCFCLTDPS